MAVLLPRDRHEVTSRYRNYAHQRVMRDELPHLAHTMLFYELRASSTRLLVSMANCADKLSDHVIWVSGETRDSLVFGQRGIPTIHIRVGGRYHQYREVGWDGPCNQWLLARADKWDL